MRTRKTKKLEKIRKSAVKKQEIFDLAEAMAGETKSMREAARAISRMTGMNEGTVYYYLHSEAPEELKARMRWGKKVRKEETERIADKVNTLVEKGSTLAEAYKTVAEEEGISPWTVRKIFSRTASPEMRAELKKKERARREESLKRARSKRSARSAVKKQEVLDLAEAMAGETKNVTELVRTISEMTGVGERSVYRYLYLEAPEELRSRIGIKYGKRPDLTGLKIEEEVDRLVARLREKPPESEAELNYLMMELVQKKGIGPKRANKIMEEAVEKYIREEEQKIKKESERKG